MHYRVPGATVLGDVPLKNDTGQGVIFCTSSPLFDYRKGIPLSLTPRALSIGNRPEIIAKT